jgi:hypothetical protein
VADVTNGANTTSPSKPLGGGSNKFKSFHSWTEGQCLLHTEQLAMEDILATCVSSLQSRRHSVQLCRVTEHAHRRSCTYSRTKTPVHCMRDRNRLAEQVLQLTVVSACRLEYRFALEVCLAPCMRLSYLTELVIQKAKLRLGGPKAPRHRGLSR